MKRISEKKLEAFTVGTMGKRKLSKKEIEEQKKKEDEAAAASVFKEFVETFQDVPNPSSKVWVKAGTYDAGSRREDNREKGKLYKPSSRLEEKTASEKAQEYAKMIASDLKKDSIILKKKSGEKKKSNLELFKEELRQIQEEREERHKYKQMNASSSSSSSHSTSQPHPTPSVPAQNSSGDSAPDQRASGSYDNGDPSTTNLYLGNLSPKTSEQELMELFGRYGPLASIKIMWPRTEEEKLRGRNCGFVAYMSRKDAERALNMLSGRMVKGYEMRVGWGKSMPLTNQPIYIPPPLLELTMPPPPSGLPFNAQPLASEMDKVPKGNYKAYTKEEEIVEMDRVLKNCVVKVFIPTEKNVLFVIHRMIEFVIREGPLFEALIMGREIDNPLYAFLYDNESPAHIYYRWKLFSLLQGDTPSEWNEKDFRMFKDGPIWHPPNPNFYTQGMPDELVVDPEATDTQKGALSNAQRDRLEDLIHYLTPERTRIGEAMIFCIEHADAADEICECISESLAVPTTIAPKKIARLYLLSDILHNCTVKVANASFFRKAVERHLPDIFESLRSYLVTIESRLKAEGFKSRVINVIRVWEEWAVYSKDFLGKLKSTFLGKSFEATMDETKIDDPDIDGAPLSGDEKEDEDLDGVPLDGAALLKSALMRNMPEAIPLQKDSQLRQNDDFHDDIDGIPFDDDIDGIPLEKVSNDNIKSGLNLGSSGAFIPSKWETIDPQQVEAQAITTSKWDTLEPPEPPKIYDSSGAESDKDGDSDNDHGRNSQKYDDELRNKLREIEVKAMHYQDELESGKRELKAGWNIREQVEHYRRKLMKKFDNSNTSSPQSYISSKKEDKYVEYDDDSPDENQRRGKKGRRSTSRTPRSRSVTKRHRSRSLSPSTPQRDRNYSSKLARYNSPTLGLSSSSSTAHAYRSPSPQHLTSSSSRSAKRDEREFYSTSRQSPSRSRSDRHKYKHKH